MGTGPYSTPLVVAKVIELQRLAQRGYHDAVLQRHATNLKQLEQHGSAPSEADPIILFRHEWQTLRVNPYTETNSGGSVGCSGLAVRYTPGVGR